jgi:hypothetical protein
VLIYGGELPQEENATMPKKAVVLHASGGYENNDYIEIVKPRLDVYCYGETYYEAGTVDRAVYDVMKHVMRKRIAGVLLHGVACGGGPIQVKHAETGWPIVWRSYQVTASDIDVT